MAAIVVAGAGTAIVAPSIAAASLVPAATGTVFGWGQDSFGQLGDGSSPAVQNAPVTMSLPSGTEVTGISAGFDHSLAVTSAGGLLAAGRNETGQLGNGTTTDSDTPVAVSVPGSVKVTAAAAGDEFSLALTSAGDRFADLEINALARFIITDRRRAET